MNDGNFQFLISSRFQIIEDLRLKGPAYHKKNVPQDVLSPSIEDNRIFCQREFTKIQRILSCKGLSGMCAIIRYYDGALSTTWVYSTEAGLHKLWYPGIRDTSTWSMLGAHREHGDVFLFSNLGALWFSENLIRHSLHICLREVKNNLFSFKHPHLRHFSWRF